MPAIPISVPGIRTVGQPLPGQVANIDNKELLDALVQLVRQGVPRTTACVKMGISVDFLKQAIFIARHGHSSGGEPVSAKAMAAWVGLATRIVQAQAEFEAELAGRVMEAARTTNRATGLPEWRAAMALLTHHPATREAWYEHKEQNVKVTVEPRGGEHEAVRELSEEELVALAQKSYAALLSPPTRERETEPEGFD